MFTLSPSGLLPNNRFDFSRFGDVDPTFISRYLIQASILDAYQKHQSNKKLKVLDVGGAGSIIAEFIDIDLTILDILPNDGNLKKYVRATALNMPFPNKSFDAVISCDVLEHIAQDDQTKFLQESARVTRDLLVLAAPFNLKGIRDAEISANEYYRKITGKNHRWLMEHLRSELPSLQKTKLILDKSGLQSEHFSHTALDNWQLVTRTGFLLGEKKQHTKFLDCIRQINQYYLDNIMPKDFSTSGYRSFIVASRRHDIDIKSEPDIFNPEHANIFTFLTDAMLPLL